MLDFSEFSTKRLKTVLSQGEYFPDEKLDAAGNELFNRGVYSKSELEKIRTKIEEKKRQLTAENAKGMAGIEMKDKLLKRSFAWKSRYTLYVSILTGLGTLIIYLKTGVLAWYIPLAATGAALGTNSLFSRKGRYMKRSE